MMKEIKLENIILKLFVENNNKVRVRSDDENVILINQEIEIVSSLIVSNFNVVYGYYKLKSNDNSELIDISRVSIAIVLHYLYMYNTWLNTYKKYANQDLRFHEQDFDNPDTSDIIINFYKRNCPELWAEKSANLMGMTIEEFRKYYVKRKEFYNK